MSREYLLPVHNSNPAGGVCSNVIWDGFYECAACVEVVRIVINVVQGLNFNREIFKKDC